MSQVNRGLAVKRLITKQNGVFDQKKKSKYTEVCYGHYGDLQAKFFFANRGWTKKKGHTFGNNAAVKMVRDIYYIYDSNLLKECDRIPVVVNRASMVHSLIEAYELLKSFIILKSEKASIEDLRLFHSVDFINFMKNAEDIDSEDESEEQMEYGLCYDCPPLPNVLDLMQTIAGSSLTAAACLMKNGCNIAINWCGGWHHAQRDEAEGFCYVNDIVIAIERLRQRYKRILYIDLDIHHGNGVENAYLYTRKVMTVSFHKFEAGFYPGTGSVDDVGLGNGKGYTVNIPMKEGVSDGTLCYLFDSIIPQVYNKYSPECVVVQCGSDCINGDPLGQTNITPYGVAKCVETIMLWNLPTMFLGGGGYNKANAARLWTYLTAVISKQQDRLSTDIPEHDYFVEYGPGYELTIEKGNQKDTNSKTYLDWVVDSIKCNFNKFDVRS